MTKSGTELFPLLSISKICNKYTLSGNRKAWRESSTTTNARRVSTIANRQRRERRTYKIPGALSKGTQGCGRTDASSDVVFTTHTMFVMSNQQPTGYSWSSSACNPPTFGVLSSAPVGGLANTPSGTAYAPAGAGAPATAASFANALIAPATAPTGGSTTDPYITQPRIAYAPAESRWTPLDTSTTPRLLGPWKLLHVSPTPRTHVDNPHVAPPGYTYQPQPPPFSLSLPATLPPYPYEACHRLNSLPHKRLRLQPAALGNVSHLLRLTNASDPSSHSCEILLVFNPRPLHLQLPPSNHTPFQKESASSLSPTGSVPSSTAFRRSFPTTIPNTLHRQPRKTALDQATFHTTRMARTATPGNHRRTLRIANKPALRLGKFGTPFIEGSSRP